MDLTSTQETILYLGTAGMAIGAVIIAVIGFSLPNVERHHVTASFFVCAIAACAYYAMATGTGTWMVDGEPVVAVIPASTQLSLKHIATVAGGKRAEMAKPELAERLTGYVVGGISPIGQKKQLPTFVDETAILHETVFVSAGRRGMDVELAPDDLLRATGASYAELGV